MENVATVFLRGARYGQAGAVVGLLLQVAVGVVSLRAGVILGGVFTIACGLAAIAVHAGDRLPAPAAGTSAAPRSPSSGRPRLRACATRGPRP